MKIRATSLLALPLLALLAGCASSGAVTRSTEYDDVYYASGDRTTTVSAPAPATPDAAAAPAADGSVANPDYYGQSNGSQAGTSSANGYSYYNDNYANGSRYNSPYYGSWNRYGSGYVYDPFWSGSTLAVGCLPGYGLYYPSFYTYAPVYVGPRVRFGVSFGWGYSSWAMPMYGYASPYFYDPFYDPFWGPGYGYGYGYSPYYSSYGYGYGYGNSYYHGFYDGYYAGGGGSHHRVTYGPRLDRSFAGVRNGYSAGGTRGTRTTRRPESPVAPGTGGGTGTYGSYPAATRVSAPTGRSNEAATPVVPVQPGAVSNQPAIRGNRNELTVPTPDNSAQPQPQPPVVRGEPRGGDAVPSRHWETAQPQAPNPIYQPQPQAQPQAQPPRQGWFDRVTRNLSNAGESNTRSETPRTSSGSSFPASGGGGGGGATRSSSGGFRRSR